MKIKSFQKSVSYQVKQRITDGRLVNFTCTISATDTQKCV